MAEHPSPSPSPSPSPTPTPTPTPRRGPGSPQAIRLVVAVIAFAVTAAGAVALIAAIAQAMVATGASRNLSESTALALGHVALIASVILAIAGIIRYGAEGFLAASWVFFPLVPPLAAAISVLGYLVYPASPSLPVSQDAPFLSGIPQDPVAAVYIGLASAILLWMLSTFPGAQLARRQRAQRRVYDDLCQRFRVLSARVDAEFGKPGAPSPGDASYKALSEAQSILAAVESKLFRGDGEGPALRWVLGNGYTSIARELHRAEEALFIVEDTAEIVGDVLHDDLSLEDSGLKNRFTLRRVIRDAMPVISQPAADTLLRPVPALPQTAALVMRAQAQAHGRANELSAQEAREALREVRFAINDYRDDIVDSFARGRNRLIWTYLMVAISTYVLLGLGMLSGIPKVTLVAVSAMYMVGSLVGLFSRLRIESTRPSTNDDYGLYLARLLTGPLLSGLAGVAGVYLVAQAPAFIGPIAEVTSAPASPGPSASPSAEDIAVAVQAVPRALADIYDLAKNHLALAVAAVFGLAPGLLTQRLQQQVDRLERDLQRSEPATSTAVAGAAPEAASEEGG
jgi:hypothetical protein